MPKALCRFCKLKPRITGKFCSKKCRQKHQEQNLRNSLGDRYEIVMQNKKLRTIDESRTYPCDRCGESMPAYYTLSLLTKGLWIKCENCGTHAVPYVAGLDLPERPSKHYLANKGKIPSLITPEMKANSKNSIPKVITNKVIIPNYNKEEVMRTHGESLTTEQKIAIVQRNKHIKKLAREGFTQAQIAKHYDLSKFTIKEIINS